LSFICCFHLVNAQRVTYADLKFTLYHSISSTEDYLLQKGFSYGGIDTLGDFHNTYKFNFTKNTSQDYICIGKKSITNVFYESSFFSYKQEDYKLFKLNIQKAGFKITSTKTFEGSLIYYYKKGNLNLEIWLFRKPDADNTMYKIYLSDTDLEHDAKKTLN